MILIFIFFILPILIGISIHYLVNFPSDFMDGLVKSGLWTGAVYVFLLIFMAID